VITVLLKFGTLEELATFSFKRQNRHLPDHQYHQISYAELKIDQE
jgi:hypothetical protein